jgi:hypothetical protein
LFLCAAVIAAAVAGFLGFATGQVVVRYGAIALFCALVALVWAYRTFLLVLLSWAGMRCRRGGPVRFDRDAGQVVFGPRKDHMAFPLSLVVAVQVIPTTALGIGGDVWAAVTADRSPTGYVLRWLASWTRVYQLNLVLRDGDRLNLVNWRVWGETEQDLARQLAEFLGVPLEGPATT